MESRTRPSGKEGADGGMTTLLTIPTFIKALSLVKEHEAIMEEIKAPLQKLGDFSLSLDIDSLHR